jgi:flagellar basal body-associated protein FliL
MSIKKKVLIIVIAIVAIIGTIFAVLVGIYYYMIHTQQQNLREAMSKHDGLLILNYQVKMLAMDNKIPWHQWIINKK